MMALTALLPLGFLFVILIGIPLCVGICVYRDAKARGMEPVLWTLVAVLVPSFIGLIVYLIVRSSHTASVCAHCGAAVQDSFVCCPSCGAKLKYTCPACGKPVDDDWKVCAHCGAELDADRPRTVVRREAGSLKWLWIVLIGIALVFVALILLMVMNVSASFEQGMATAVIDIA